QKALPANKDLLMQFFNTSNLMAYAEEVQLEGDDKKYSYIRIYDPDQRQVIKDIKIGEDINYVSRIIIRNDDNYFLYMTNPSNDVRFYDYSNNKNIEYSIPNIDAPIFSDESLIATITFKGYSFDWTVGVEDNPEINPILYPNPTTNFIMLNVDAKFFGGNWQLTNLNGAVVLHGLILPNPDLQINLSHLPSQIYYLQLQKDNFTVTYQVVKL